MRTLHRVHATIAVCAAVGLLVIPVTARPVRAQSAPNGSLVILTDFVLGGPTSGPDVPSCVQLSRFAQGSKVVVRTRVIDGATGQALTDSDLSSVQVTLDGNAAMSEAYGGHPGGTAPKTDYFWSAAWTIPTNYATGSVNVTVTATANDGRTATWEPFNVAPSALTVIPAAGS
jgi:hypothetical protein